MNKVSNEIVAQPKERTFSQKLQSKAYQDFLASAIKDEKRRNRLVTGIVAAVSANPMLQRCDAQSILSGAMQGEALGLSPSPSLGEYWLVPYRVGKPDFNNPQNDKYKAQFQLGVAGRIQLAMRSGQYKDIDTIEVKAGEFKGRNPETGKPIFSFIEDEDVRENTETIGYLAYFILNNGFYHSVYFSKEKCLKWAERYSKAFDRDLYERYVRGEITNWKEQQKCSSPWYEHFSVMAQNTVLKQCLKRGPKSIEMRGIEELEAEQDSEITASIIEPEELPEPEAHEEPEEINESEAKEPARRGRKKKESVEPENSPEEEFFA